MSEIPPPVPPATPPEFPGPGASPPPPPPGPPAMDYQSQYGLQVDRDVEHLKVLSICWYVAAGLAVLMGCFPLLYVGLGIAFITNEGAFAGGGGPPPPPAMGWMFIVMGGCASMLGWLGVILGVITARSLPQRRRLVLCYVAAALACLWIPVGTVLGIFTFIVLARPSIKASFT
jgi:hypothetical protein